MSLFWISLVNCVQPVLFNNSVWWNRATWSVCRYAIDAMQSVCMKEARKSGTHRLHEETTLMQLIFGGYLRSKVFFTVHRTSLNFCCLYSITWDQLCNEAPLLLTAFFLLLDKMHKMWCYFRATWAYFGSYCWNRWRHQFTGRSTWAIYIYRSLGWR